MLYSDNQIPKINTFQKRGLVSFFNDNYDYKLNEYLSNIYQ